MDRATINQILADGGIDTATAKAVVTNLMNSFNEEKRVAIEEAANNAKAEFKDYISPEDHKKSLDEIATLKDASAKASRTGKYKEKGISEKWLEYADSKLKDSKDFDNDLEGFLKENPELLVKKEEPKKQEKQVIVKSNFGDTKTNPPANEAPKTMREALAEKYANEQKQ